MYTWYQKGVVVLGCVVNFGLHYWGEPERAPHRRYSWEISYIMVIIIMVRPSPARRGWSHEVCRASVTARGSQYILPGKSCTARWFPCFCSRVVHSMSSTKEQRVSSPLTSELAVDERERRLQRRRERERARRDST